MGLKFHDFSPLAAMVTGKGSLGKAISEGLGGVIPSMIARNARQQDEEEAALAQKALSTVGNVGTVTRMKNGGSASARADGIAQRGKTRGKIC